MTFTEADLANLKAALISGARKVQIGDRVVEYRSQAEILATIKMIEDSLSEDISADTNPNVVVAGYSRGEV